MTARAIEVHPCSKLLGTMAVSNNRAVCLELLCNQLGEPFTQSMAAQAIETATRFIVRRSKKLPSGSPGNRNIFRSSPITECLPLFAFINTNILHWGGKRQESIT